MYTSRRTYQWNGDIGPTLIVSWKTGENRAVYMVFIDLEKAYDRVPRQEVWMRNREKGLPDIYVMIVQDIHV